MSFAEAKAPPPSPSTAPVNSKDVDERAIRQIADLNLTDQVRQDASPKQMTREKVRSDEEQSDDWSEATAKVSYRLLV